MTLGSLAQIPYMNCRFKTKSKILRKTCYNRSFDIKTKGKYSFLTTSSECYCLVHIRFRLLEVIVYVIDELCVRRFHFILLEIKLYGGVVTVLDSRRKDPQEYTDMTAMLQK
jgi:hypothetical protein